MISPSPSKCLLKAMPSSVFAEEISQRVLTILEARPANSLPSSSMRSKAHSMAAYRDADDGESRIPRGRFVDHDCLAIDEERATGKLASASAIFGKRAVKS